MKEVFSALMGSRLYGMDTPESDFDYKRVVLPPLNDMILGKRLAITREWPDGPDGNTEIEVIPLQRFLDDFGLGKIYAVELAFVINRDGAGVEWWMPMMMRRFLTRNTDYTPRTFDGPDDQVDRKALAHTIRFIEQIVELNSTGKMTFPRVNAKYLLGIKSGTVPLPEARTRLAELYEQAFQSATASMILPERTTALAEEYEAFKLQIIRGAYGLMAAQK